MPADLLLPTYDGSSLRAVMPAVLESLGHSTRSAQRDSAEDLATLGLPTARRACVVMLDGVGAHLLRERGGHCPFLRRELADSLTLRTGYPSTTAASLTLLGTGESPGTTGMLGYTVRHPASGELMNLISWLDAPAAPEEWQRVPTLVEQVGQVRERVVSIGLPRFADSGLTRAALRGPRFIGATELGHRVDAAVAELRGRSADLVYLYWGDVDTTGHHFGWKSAEWGEAMELVDAELSRLARELPRDTLLVVTADHGMIDLEADSRIDVAHEPALSADVELVAGEPRAVHVHTATDRAAQVQARWTEFLGDSAWVLSREEAIAAGLFGEVTDAHREVIGDIVVATRGTRAVMDSRTQTAASLRLIGVHGSLTPAELEVPLIRLAT
ncbi:MAG TPA: alkaline phosphatase family protein [Actinomycetaceae bacterium]|nr:alkaline phosphatase family protein [Actinomycetaceae bacterium]